MPERPWDWGTWRCEACGEEMPGERGELPLDHVHNCEDATGESLVFSEQQEQEDGLTTDELGAEDFQTVLTEEYDILLVEVESDLYHVPAMRCDSCGTIDETVYAPTYEALDAAMAAASSAAGAVNEEEFEDDPEVGMLVCVQCGDGIGTDLSDRSKLVLDSEAWEQYVEYREEQGEPI